MRVRVRCVDINGACGHGVPVNGCHSEKWSREHPDFKTGEDGVLCSELMDIFQIGKTLTLKVCSLLSSLRTSLAHAVPRRAVGGHDELCACMHVHGVVHWPRLVKRLATQTPRVLRARNVDLF